MWVGSPNFHTQNGIGKKFIVMHWIVGDLDSADARFKLKSAPVRCREGLRVCLR